MPAAGCCSAPSIRSTAASRGRWTSPPPRGDESLGPAVAIVLLGRPTRTPLELAGGCTLYLDAGLLLPVATVPVLGRSWQASLVIANDHSLTGARILLQALIGPSAARLGFDLSNGVALSLGL